MPSVSKRTCGIEALVAAAMRVRAAAGLDMLEATSDLFRAVADLDMEAAGELNAALCAHTLHRLGVIDFPAPSIADVPLLELAGASRIVRAADTAANVLKLDQGRPTSHRMVMDDRGVAALYTACHYDAIGPGELEDGAAEPLAELPGKGLFLIRFKRATAETQDQD